MKLYEPMSGPVNFKLIYSTFVMNNLNINIDTYNEKIFNFTDDDLFKRVFHFRTRIYESQWRKSLDRGQPTLLSNTKRL